MQFSTTYGSLASLGGVNLKQAIIPIGAHRAVPIHAPDRRARVHPRTDVKKRRTAKWHSKILEAFYGICSTTRLGYSTIAVHTEVRERIRAHISIGKPHDRRGCEPGQLERSDSQDRSSLIKRGPMHWAQRNAVSTASR